MNQSPNVYPLTLTAVIVVLLIASAFNVTAKYALVIGGFLFLLVWVSAYQTGQLQQFGRNIL